MNTLDWQDISKIEAKIRRDEDDLKAYQKYVYKRLEDYRQRHGLRVIRFVLPRDGVKSLESVIEKIVRKREEEDNYGYDDIDDLIGVKVICPYLSSARQVGRWICSNDDFGRVVADGVDVTPKHKDEADEKLDKVLKSATKRYSRGYRGIHFVVEPPVGLNPSWAGLECEVQLKTMCQEAWDAMTHGTTYKFEHRIESAMLEHMKQLSRVLSAVDRQGEIVRRQVQQAEQEDREHKRVAAMDLLVQSRLRAEKDRIADVPVGDIESPEDLGQEEIIALTKEVDRRKRKSTINATTCYLAGVVALCSDNPEHKTLAYRITKQFVEPHGSSPRHLNTAATLCWALNRLNDAVRFGEDTLSELPDGHEEKLSYQSNLAYWVAEALKAGKRVAQGTLSSVNEFISEIKLQDTNDPGILDSVGFSKVVTAESVSAAEEGMELLERSWEEAQKAQSPSIQRLASRFYERHKRYAYQKISRLISGS